MHPYSFASFNRENLWLLGGAPQMWGIRRIEDFSPATKFTESTECMDDFLNPAVVNTDPNEVTVTISKKRLLASCRTFTSVESAELI